MKCPICAMPRGVPQDRAYLMGYAMGVKLAAPDIIQPAVTHALPAHVFRGSLCVDHKTFLGALLEGKVMA